MLVQSHGNFGVLDCTLCFAIFQIMISQRKAQGGGILPAGQHLFQFPDQDAIRARTSA
jgi:hypothetical protein